MEFSEMKSAKRVNWVMRISIKGKLYEREKRDLMFMDCFSGY